jgi:hypothetical protein
MSRTIATQHPAVVKSGRTLMTLNRNKQYTTIAALVAGLLVAVVAAGAFPTASHR